MTASKIMAKRAAAGTLALAVCLTGGIVSAGAANAAAGFNFNTRIAGDDRYLTSVEASKAAFPTGAGSVVITNGLSEVDGLTASYVAGLHSAPILYTSGPSTISAAVQAEIARLKPTTVYIVGGETVVTKTVEDALKATAGVTTVTRYGGADRYETAAKVATSGTAKPAKVIVASGVSFADALVAGPVAYKQKYPILLTAATGVPSYTAAALTTLAVPTVNVIGGTTVVTEATYTAVGGDKRLAGDTRQGTAVAVATDSIANEGFSSANVALVGNTNANAADALVAAPLAAQNSTPILFIDNAGSTVTNTYLSTNAPLLTGKGYVFGGTTAVPAAAVAAATTAASRATTGNQTIAVSPAEATTQTIVSDTGGTQVTSDDRTYTVTGLTAGTTYRITLVNGASIQRAADGSVTFLTSTTDQDSAGKYLVNPGADIADFTAVNNATPPFTGAEVTAGSRSVAVQPVNGSITFTVDATAPGTIVPVVYVNGAAGGTATTGGVNARLETTATTGGVFAPASENFGLGGSILYVATRGGNGAFGGVNTSGAISGAATITSVDKAGNTFTASVDTDNSATAGNVTLEPRSYAFDANDTFQIDGNSVGFETFKAALSAGDGVQGTYTTDVTGVSAFSLADSNPALTANSATATPVAGAANTNDITLAAAFAADSLDSVTIERAPTSTGVYVPVTTVTPTATATTLSYVDNDVAAGAYTYRFTPINDGDPGAAQTVNITVVAPAAVDSTAPTLLSSSQTTVAGLANTFDTGDVIKLVASEVLAPVVAGDTFRLTDADGTVADIANGGAGTFVLNTADETVAGTVYPAGRVLTITLTGTPATITAGSTAGLQSPATITDQSGTTDQAGNLLSLASGDRSVG